MEITICENLMWKFISNVSIKYVCNQVDELKINDLTKKSKAKYKEILNRTPDIGPLLKNPLRVSLSGGAVWLAIYESADGRISEELFGKMVKESMSTPIMKKVFGGKKPFSIKAQQKKLKSTEVANKISNSPFNWKTEYIPGRDENEYRINYYGCGLCELGKQEKLSQLVPYMCQSDFISVDMMGGVLQRTKTLASGGDCCDFYVYKKGSKWDK